MFFEIQGDLREKYCYALSNKALIKYEHNICVQCGRTIAIPQYTSNSPCLELDGGSVFPDLLRFCGVGDRLFLLSEQALNLFEKHNVSGYTDYQPVNIEPYIKRKKILTPPTYYSLDILGRIDLNLEAMCLKRKRKCAVCGQFDWNRMRMHPLILNQTSWDGSDLCLLTSMPGFKICTERVLEIVQTNALTGFDFENLNSAD